MNKEQIVMLAVKEMTASPWNRTDLGNGDLKELSESIKADGVLVPLIVRSKKSGNHEIVAGHRRWKAADMAGVVMVPCVVRELDDEKAREVQIIENLHRKNLNPMEEARAFQQLGVGDNTAQRIAEMIGKDVKYVYRAMSLLELPAKAQRAIEKGVISAAHGHQLARVGPKQIDAAVAYATTPGWKNEIPSIVALKTYISQRVEKKLSAAPFEKNKEFAGKIACKGCPSNSGNQDALFDDAEDGFCTNGTCFAAKLAQFYRDLQAAGQKKWPNLKFIGTAASGYGETQIIKGYKVIEAGSPQAQKAATGVTMDSGYVEGWGFGILKPSNWGTSKVAKLVVLKKMKEGEGVQNHQEDPDEQYRWRFRRLYAEKHCQVERAAMDKACAVFRKVEDKVLAAADAIWKKDKENIIAEFKKSELTNKEPK